MPLLLFLASCDQQPATYDGCMLAMMKKQSINAMYYHAESYCKEKFPDNYALSTEEKL